MSPIRRDALPVLVARGFLSAGTAWKALLILLVVNALLSLALVRPAASALHQTLDRLPGAEALVKGGETTLWSHFQRIRPDVFGSFSVPGLSRSGRRGTSSAALPTGMAGTLLFLGFINALVASLFSGGFAGRFAAESGEGDLGAFAADSIRYAATSLFLSLLSAAGIAGAWLGLFAAPARLYDETGLSFEWEVTGLFLVRILAFLLAAGLVRMFILATRAAVGLSGKANPLPALGSALGRIVRSPLKALFIEVSFGILALAPLAAWGLFAPVWDGADPWYLALFVLLQELLVLWRIAARVAQLGAVAAWLRGSESQALERAEASPAV